MESLAAQPFGDLTSRPLFLCQLLVIFEQTGTIPEQPSDAVERVVRLALDEWDVRHKRHPRRSQYASFDSTKKRDFLATMAFWFLYKLSRERFTTGLLELAYLDIHERFSLPPDDARLVAQELETHTGIFVEVGREFEFSHLSIQEYLAATYLVRQPIGHEYTTYLTSRPGPIAITVALSTKPETWLADLLLRDSNLVSLDANTLRSLFARVLQERPAFMSSLELGLVGITLLATLKFRDEFVRQFLELAVVRQSIKMAGPSYRLSFGNGHYRLDLRNEVSTLLPHAAIGPTVLSIAEADMLEIEASGLLRRADIWA